MYTVLFCFYFFLLNYVDNKKILFLSDIHLEILYDSKSQTVSPDKCKHYPDYLDNKFDEFDFGRYDCNPSGVLFSSALTKAKERNENYDLIIIGGDHIAHRLYELHFNSSTEDQKLVNKELFKKTYEKIYSTVRDFFPNTIIISTIGNNDFYEHYKTPTKESREYQANIIKKIMFSDRAEYKNENFNPDLEKTLQDGYYYSYRLWNIKFIVLNSNYFTTQADEGSGENQLVWLEQELTSSLLEKTKCILLMHIPPFPQYYNNDILFFYKTDIVDRFEDLMFRFRENILYVFSSHVHWYKMGVRFTEIEKGTNHIHIPRRRPRIMRSFLVNNYEFVYYFPLLDFQAMSPVYYNNPSFAVIDYDNEKFKINNINTYHANLIDTLSDDRKWSLNKKIDNNELWKITYSFKDDFGFDKFDAKDLYDFIYLRLEDKEIIQKYQYLIGGMPWQKELNQKYIEILKQQGMVDPENNYKKFKCVMKVLTPLEYKKCLA
jgi:hypothetical protein